MSIYFLSKFYADMYFLKYFSTNNRILFGIMMQNEIY